MENGKQGAFACADGVAHQPGLTKREYFAAMAMQSLLSNRRSLTTVERGNIVNVSVIMADILLKELESK